MWGRGPGRETYLTWSAVRDEPTLAPPRLGAGDEHEAVNPTDHLLVFGVLRTGLEVSGLVEFFMRGDSRPQAERGYLRFVTQMCKFGRQVPYRPSARQFF